MRKSKKQKSSALKSSVLVTSPTKVPASVVNLSPRGHANADLSPMTGAIKNVGNESIIETSSTAATNTEDKVVVMIKADDEEKGDGV